DLTAATFDPTRTALHGSGGRFGFSKIGGQHLRFNSNWTFKSPGFDADDLGFFRRADQRTMNHFLQIRSDVPTRWFRNRYVNFNQFASWNYEGDRFDGGGNVNGGATFVNNWQMNAGFGINLAGFDDRTTRGGPSVRTNPMRVSWS